MKDSQMTSDKWQTGKPDARTLKQKLATDYNFMLFRAKGAVLYPPSGRKIPALLLLRLNAYEKARKQLIHTLEQQIFRDVFMTINLKEEENERN